MKAVILFLTLMLIVACGGDDENNANNTNNANNEEELPEADGCEHMSEGPFADVSGGDATENAVMLEKTHTKTTVTLVEELGGGTGNVAFLQIEVAEEAEYFLFLSADLDVTLSGSGTTLDAERTVTPLDECSEDVAKMLVYDLGVGTWDVLIGPSDETTVDLVYLPGGDDHDEDE